MEKRNTRELTGRWFLLTRHKDDVGLIKRNFMFFLGFIRLKRIHSPSPHADF